MDESIPLRILVTSRDTVGLDQSFSAIPPSLVQSLPMSTKDTESDIRLLIDKRTQVLRVVGPDDRGTLAENILVKFKGSFLWTILVLEELLRCHSRKEIHQILENVPRGMEPLYERTLDHMSQAARGKELAKTILIWTSRTPSGTPCALALSTSHKLLAVAYNLYEYDRETVYIAKFTSDGTRSYNTISIFHYTLILCSLLTLCRLQ